MFCKSLSQIKFCSLFARKIVKKKQNIKFDMKTFQLGLLLLAENNYKNIIRKN
jgi:hypothetical protein